MNIIKTWEEYKKSDHRVPEFDRALAGFADALGIDKDRAIDAISKLVSQDPSLARTSSSAFPLIKSANSAATDAVNDILGFLKALEGTDDDAIQAARAQVDGILAGDDLNRKKALHEAIGIHKTIYPKPGFAQKLSTSSLRPLTDLLSKGPESLSDLKYIKGMWKTEGHLQSVIKKLLDAAADGDQDAIDDFVEMSKTGKGKEYLAGVDKNTLAEKITSISRRAPGRINTRDIMKAHEVVGRSLASAAARAADPNRLWNILGDTFGRHRTVMDRLRAVWRATKFLPGILKFVVVPGALIGGAAYGVNKAYEGIREFFGDTGTDASAPPGASGPGGTSAAPGSPAAGSGTVADRVRGELQKIYSKE
jgi:hypothetical protein